MILRETKPYLKSVLRTLVTLVVIYVLGSGPMIGVILMLERNGSASAELLSVVARPFAPIFRLAMSSTCMLGKGLCVYVNLWVPADEEISGRFLLGE